LTLAGCASLVEQEVLPLFGDAFTLAHYRDPAQAKVAFDMAEQALICYYRPCLNKEFNQNPRPLPDKYRK
jgi:hypothetical protein